VFRYISMILKSDYNMNIGEIKNIYILCTVCWSKNYIQDARYIHRNSRGSVSLSIPYISPSPLNKLILRTNSLVLHAIPKQVLSYFRLLFLLLKCNIATGRSMRGMRPQHTPKLCDCFVHHLNSQGFFVIFVPKTWHSRTEIRHAALCARNTLVICNCFNNKDVHKTCERGDTSELKFCCLKTINRKINYVENPCRPFLKQYSWSKAGEK
jgi:hypothetical protein